MATSAKPQRNNAIELWRFIFTIGISFAHFHFFGVYPLGIDPSTYILKGGTLFAAFVVLSGYFMMDGYMRKLQKGVLEGQSASTQSWAYFGKRYLALGPAAFLASLAAFIVRNAINKTPLSMIPSLFLSSVYEFLSLNQIGFVGVNEVFSNAELAELLAGGVTTTYWNTVLWYVSALLVGGTMLYYMLAKNRDLFVGLICPFIILGVYGVEGYKGYNTLYNGTGEIFPKGALGFLSIPNGVLRVTAGMCIGVLLWYVVDFFKSRQLSSTAKGILTVLNAFFSVLFLWTTWFGFSFGELQRELLQTIFMGVLLIGQDSLSKLYNQKWAGYLGRLSLYFYLSHIVTTFAISALFPTLPYMSLAAIFFFSTLAVSVLFKLLDDTVITNCFRKPIQAFVSGK